jgi:TRAP-type C4-dicarboxylate transport system permease large subunit
MGGIYSGLFTATEAASVGVVGAFLVALFRGKLRGGAFWNVMGETASITAMIYVLILGGITISFFLGITELPEVLTTKVAQKDLPPLGIIAILLVVYILLGAVMESFSIMVITVPVISGLIIDLGFDLTWWGVIMLVVVEIGLITPPFGINVFVLKAVAGADLPLTAVFRGVMPFVGADIVKLILLVLLPSLVLWLPSTMFN